MIYCSNSMYNEGILLSNQNLQYYFPCSLEEISNIKIISTKIHNQRLLYPIIKQKGNPIIRKGKI